MTLWNKILIGLLTATLVLVMSGLIIFAISDLSNYDPALSTGEVILEQYKPREIVVTADGHRMVDQPGYWYIRFEKDGKWREIRLHEWQTMHVNVGDFVVVRGDYDFDAF